GRAPAPTPKQVTTVVATPRSASTPRQQGTRRLGKAFLDAGTAACYCVSAASRSHNVQCSGGMAPAPPARSARRNGGIQMAQRIGITERAGVLHIFTAVAAAGYRQALTWLRPDVAAGVLHAERAAGGRYGFGRGCSRCRRRRGIVGQRRAGQTRKQQACQNALDHLSTSAALGSTGPLDHTREV